MNDMKTRIDLFDEAKPYARFYESAQGAIVQLHTRRIEGLGFGRVGWRLSASVCGPDGLTLSDENGLQVLRGAAGEIYFHELTVHSESVDDLAALLETERAKLAQVAANASEVWQSAADIF
jgi:hypothetical protein